MKGWIIKVFLLTFIMSISFGSIINILIQNSTQIFILFNIILVMLIAFFFDMVATSALICNESTFHAMNAQRVKGAKETLWIIKNQVKFVSICADVIGDILGIVSGGLGAVLAINIASTTKFNIAITSAIVAAFISAFTVGGKAACKEYALKNSDKIIFGFAKIIRLFKIK